MSAFLRIALPLALGAVAATAQSGQIVQSVADCPALPVRAVAPTNVTDLAPSDFKALMIIGDSILAGFGELGAQRLTNLTHDLFEDRGISYGSGADAGADSLFNYFAQFSPSLQGGSHGQHLFEVCYGILCPPGTHIPAIDGLNAAQSGAMVSNLMEEVDYIVGQLQASTVIDMENDWKV
ncbi:hypothetical protein BDK51DRAFT_51817, partial [Blyttiomyces helicus]